MKNMDPRVPALAAKAAAQWDDLPDRSELRFYNLTRQVVRGAAVGKDKHELILRQVRAVAARDYGMKPQRRA
jgi:hypothetical protein